MVKTKKGKKPTDDTNEDCPPVSDNKEKTDDSDSETEKPKVSKPMGKKKPKREAKKSKSVHTDSEGEDVAPVPSKGGFALLMAEDGDSDSAEVEPVEEELSDDEPVIQKSKPADKGAKKSKKSRRKKDDDDEEDIDKVLAELEMEYTGQKPKEAPVEDQVLEDKKESKKAKKKDKKKAAAEATDDIPVEEQQAEENEADAEPVVKTANQKKKDKKKEKKKEKKEDTPEADPEEKVGEDLEDEDDDKKGKKKKKGKDDKGKDVKGPGKKTIAAMQEALKKIKEDEERLKQEEEDRIQREEIEEKEREEAIRLEKERKEKRKQKEKDRKERMKAEGRLLTAKQKQDKARAQELINSLKALGLELPEPGEKKVRPGTRIKPNKKQVPPAPQETQGTANAETTNSEDASTPAAVEVVIVDEPAKTVEQEIKDSWDAESSGDEKKSAPKENKKPPPAKDIAIKKQESVEKSEDTSEEGDDEDDDDESETESESGDDSESDDEPEEHKTEASKKREKALERIQRRKEESEKKRSLDYLRAAVVCVLGHVDTGKTKILDKLRRTNVQTGEAGGITQQIGATNVPMDNIKENCKLVKGFSEMEIKLPGLLIIDTPGHESFSNLRSRGSSLCDIAILVVDIMHGLEPQTIESINLLKSRKTPFIVALNKIDRLYDWQTMGRRDIRDIIKGQAENTQLEFQQRTKEAVVQFAEQGLNAALFYDSPDLRSYVSLVPTSAITGEGMGNLLALIVEFCQTMLAKRLMYSELLQATVLEVKAIPGLGTTIDCILINGKLAEGDTIILAGTDGPVITQIRSLLMPQPMRELRVKNNYIEYKEIKAAQGVKIAGKDLEKAIAGLNLQVAEKPDEVEILCEEVSRELKSALSNIKLKDRGVYVQASTLGSLEALLEFLRTSKIPVANIRIGPVVKKDVMKASIMLEHESQYATILAFDVKIERDAQDLADSLGVKIFQADIIYHLFDKFMAYREELKMKKREEFKHIAVFPCKLRIMPQFVFNSRDPIVVGVMVEAGIVKEGTPICVPSKEFLHIGVVTSVEQNHKPVESARKGMEVCIKIENNTGEAPKLFGRHFDHTDILTSKISRQSIDACKDYFRDDLGKADWQLMVDLKKLFQIM